MVAFAGLDRIGRLGSSRLGFDFVCVDFLVAFGGVVVKVAENRLSLPTELEGRRCSRGGSSPALSGGVSRGKTNGG